MLIGYNKRGLFLNERHWAKREEQIGPVEFSMLCFFYFYIYIFLKSWGIETSRPRVYIYIYGYSSERDPPWLLPSNSSILPIFSPTLPRRNRGRKRERRGRRLAPRVVLIALERKRRERERENEKRNGTSMTRTRNTHNVHTKEEIIISSLTLQRAPSIRWPLGVVSALTFSS